VYIWTNRDGSLESFWNDTWLRGSSPLKSQCSSNESLEETIRGISPMQKHKSISSRLVTKAVWVEVESDNAVLIDTIINGFAANSNTVEVRLIHEGCNRNWQVKLRHVLRESNKVVDCLTKTARGGMNQLVVLVDLPSHV
ncbi:hypothetical protein Gohar_023478, partial [Gossypium harknessii]|nr:hypothetical protein [Gossypium harknessii]